MYYDGAQVAVGPVLGRVELLRRLLVYRVELRRDRAAARHAAAALPEQQRARRPRAPRARVRLAHEPQRRRPLPRPVRHAARAQHTRPRRLLPRRRHARHRPQRVPHAPPDQRALLRGTTAQNTISSSVLSYPYVALDLVQIMLIKLRLLSKFLS